MNSRKCLSPVTVQFLACVLGLVHGTSSHVALGVQERTEKPSEKDVRFFEAEIRPILVEHCYACHSVDSGNAEGGLRVDSRNAIRKGGSSGAAVVPGDLRASLLVRAIRYNDKEFAMPPADSGGKLSDDKIALLEKWIQRGAPDPREDPQGVSADPYSDAKNWWAFQPIQKPTVPNLDKDSWSYSDIDRFVAHQHRERSLEVAGDAEPMTLLRRVYFDLIGLPPSLQDQQTFQREITEKQSVRRALESTVDRLLVSDQFGMHWGRHWLDVARYAESSGKENNVAYPHAWRYRDYVIDAWNANMPYDQFLKEQIAGDLLPAGNERDRARQTTATGFLAIGAKSLNERDFRQFAVDMADEQIDAVFQATMGLTVGCARCHDHKFDPVSQRDYTAVAGIFLSTETKYGTVGGPQARNFGRLAELPSNQQVAQNKKTTKQIEEMKNRLKELLAERDALIAERIKDKDGAANPKLLRVSSLIAAIEGDLKSFNEDGTPKVLAMAVSDKPQARSRFIARGPNRRPSGLDTLVDSPLFVRGDIERAGSQVPRGLLSLFEGSASIKIPADCSGRKQLAEWIVSKENPMTARVAVNRIWYWLFGQGIVVSLDNFGTTGAKPSHPELLDFLASQFVANHWDSKKLIREIVLSHTYQLSSEYNESNFRKDPENESLWRFNRRRLTGEAIRDSMLAASGRLNTSPVNGSAIAKAGDGNIGGLRGRGMSEDEIVKVEANYRSVYLPIARNVVPEILETFDIPDASSVQTLRESTNVPIQSLYMLNSEFASKQASELATRVLQQVPGKLATDSFSDRIQLAYQLVFARKPNPTEQRLARKLIESKNKQPLAAWSSLARSLFATAEFRYID